MESYFYLLCTFLPQVPTTKLRAPHSLSHRCSQLPNPPTTAVQNSSILFSLRRRHGTHVHQLPPSSSLTANPASCDHLLDEATTPSSATPLGTQGLTTVQCTQLGYPRMEPYFYLLCTFLPQSLYVSFSPISFAISWNKFYNFPKICHGVEYIYYGIDLCKIVYVCLKGYMQLFNLNIKRFLTLEKKENKVQLSNLVWKELSTNCYAGKFLFRTFWLRPKIHRNEIKLFDYFLSNMITLLVYFLKE